MKNEKEIWLDSVEIKQLLEGGLFWKDIQPKISLGDKDGFKRNLKKEDVSIDDIIWEPVVNNQPIINSAPDPGSNRELNEESDQLRAILLGEENREESREQETVEDRPSITSEVIKDRQIDIKFIQEQELTKVPHAAVKEESDNIFAEDSEVKADEKDTFSGMMFRENQGTTTPKSIISSGKEDRHLDEDFYEELENERAPFGGLKLIVLLLISAAVTFGFWYYFLSR